MWPLIFVPRSPALPCLLLQPLSSNSPELCSTLVLLLPPRISLCRFSSLPPPRPLLPAGVWRRATRLTCNSLRPSTRSFMRSTPSHSPSHTTIHSARSCSLRRWRLGLHRFTFAAALPLDLLPALLPRITRRLIRLQFFVLPAAAVCAFARAAISFRRSSKRFLHPIQYCAWPVGRAVTGLV